MKSETVELAEAFVTNLLKKGLTPDHRYHNMAHTMSTRDSCLSIGKRYQLEEDELEVLELAALFHDTGFTKIYNGHEDESKKIAAMFLEENNYPPKKIRKVQDLIEATKLGVEPETLMQKIIKDADFNTIDNSYTEKSKALRHEWKVFNGVEMSESEWAENNFNFWKNHRFYTGEGLSLFGEEKRQTQKKLKKDRKKPKEKKPDSEEEKAQFAINDSKSAQMMFKTTLRNHVHLTNIADNKANIMLSINAALITFGIPLMAGYIDKFPPLIYPAVTLLCTCILAIVYATLATRPVKMHGYTPKETILEGKTNLFFFGNFYKMQIDEYSSGLLEIVKNEEYLDNAIVADLFYLGKTLGVKFQRLRICYAIFMYGMVTTVTIFSISFIFWR